MTDIDMQTTRTTIDDLETTAPAATAEDTALSRDTLAEAAAETMAPESGSQANGHLSEHVAQPPPDAPVDDDIAASVAEATAEPAAVEPPAVPAEPIADAVADHADDAEPTDASAETGVDARDAAPVESAAIDFANAGTAPLPALQSDLPAVEVDWTADIGKTPEYAPGEAPEAAAEAVVVSDAERFAKFEERAAALATEVEIAPNRATFLGRVRRLIGQIPDDLAVEGVAALKARLGDLEGVIQTQIDERRTAKEAIVSRAEALADANEWKATGEALRGLFDEWKAIGSAGHEVEDPLWKRFQAARDRFSERRNEWFEGRQKEWAANREKKEALCVRAEEMNQSTEWRQTADAMRNLMGEWKTIGSAGRESDDALWSRFRAAQQVFFDNRSKTYDDNKRRKEEICDQAETLRESTDWRQTADALKGLQAAWKEIGPVGNRDLEDALWNRFRGATQSFFDRRGSTFAERDREEIDNLRRKEELCAAAEALAVAADPVAATEEAKALQAEWKTIGPVRRDRGDALWARFRAACDRIFESSVNERARRQVAWSSKMRDAMLRKEEQLARLEEAIAFDEQTVSRWEAAVASKPDPALSTKIRDTTVRIGEKRARAEELRASINDILAKMGS